MDLIVIVTLTVEVLESVVWIGFLEGFNDMINFTRYEGKGESSKLVKRRSRVFTSSSDYKKSGRV